MDARIEGMARLDRAAQEFLRSGRLRVDRITGLVYAREAKNPARPVGAPNARGYLRTCITTKGVAVTLMVHRIVWIACNGLPTPGQQINHKDGVKTNNRPENLELVTPATNNEHARSTGLWKPNRGLVNGAAKLSEDQIAAIRAARMAGESSRSIAAMFGVTASYVRRVVARTVRA